MLATALGNGGGAKTVVVTERYLQMVATGLGLTSAGHIRNGKTNAADVVRESVSLGEEAPTIKIQITKYLAPGDACEPRFCFSDTDRVFQAEEIERG